jgi:hypothetical protein
LTGGGVCQVLWIKQDVRRDDPGVEHVADEAHTFEHKNPLTLTRRTIVAE